jgi:Tol biopolymer transport system component
MTRIRWWLAPATVALLASTAPVAQTSKIVFVTDRVGRDAPDEIYVMNADGTDERRLTVSAAGNNLFPRWSPDGKRIAFTSNRSGDFQIFVMDADGAHLTQLTTGGGAHPCWSPDGTRLAFTGRGVGDAPDILVIRADGTGLVNLTNSPTNEQRPDWSPDGKRIAFNGNRDGNAEIYAIDVDGTGGPVRLTSDPAADLAPKWSPDGRQIAFESARDGNREIYVSNADGTKPVRLTVDARIDASPSWSPDGRMIVFQRQVVVLPGLAPPNGSELFVMNADGTGQRQLTHRTPESFSAFPSWGPRPAAER